MRSSCHRPHGLHMRSELPLHFGLLVPRHSHRRFNVWRCYHRNNRYPDHNRYNRRNATDYYRSAYDHGFDNRHDNGIDERDDDGYDQCNDNR